jgi:hypothetical protein
LFHPSRAGAVLEPPGGIARRWTQRIHHINEQLGQTVLLAINGP